MSQDPLTLRQLQARASAFGAQVHGNGQQLVSHVTQDSRRVRAGATFAVISGTHHDGSAYIPAALTAGASSLLVARDVSEQVLRRFPDVPALVVDDIQAALGPLAHAALGDPARTVAVTGVTGTNGKTTIAGLFRQCFEALGIRAASIGTLGYISGEQVSDFGMTTPNADLVAEYLHRARNEGVAELAIEVSSHALALGRVDGFTFRAGGYANLTQDHLDFHGTFEAYAAAKRRLFDADRCQRAVLYTVDKHLSKLAHQLTPTWGNRLLCVGDDATSGLRLDSIELGLHETRFSVTHLGRTTAYRTQLLGAHNVANWLVTLGLLVSRGVALEQLTAVVPQIEPAPGRLQRCDTAEDDICVLVDYAHTPDALERALQACRALEPRSVWCVFGCGGDRDRGKRPLMGEVAARLADVTIVTNDNPRTEDPEGIAREILLGARASEPRVQLDRALAIAQAIGEAHPGDLVLIAGKGHEDYQIFGKTKVHFDDCEVAVAALQRRRTRLPKGQP